MNFSKINNVYFIGIGGIGMSAQARYFKALGKNVAGYDRSPSQLTHNLQGEGIAVNYNDAISVIPVSFTNKENTLVIYTPAIPADNSILQYFKTNNFDLKKRAEVLGIISKNKKVIAVAGTHGKTTTSTLIAHILKQSKLDCAAFLGGISKNYETNLLLPKSDQTEYVVVEADEYDRSFLQLHPYLAVITSVDPDHLDIYGTYDEIKKAFVEFTNLISNDGHLVIKSGVELNLNKKKGFFKYPYGFHFDDQIFCPKNLMLYEGHYLFDAVIPYGDDIEDLKLGVPGLVNVENAIAAITVAHILGVSDKEIRNALATFKGVVRRMDVHLRSPQIVYIDDYAHHPAEIKACINSVRSMFEGKKITGIFQPHLYSRTRDFADEFAESLSLLDKVILLDIYPAREQPIEGVTSQIIFDKITSPEKVLLSKLNFMDYLLNETPEVLLTMGAGDIDKFVDTITMMFEKKYLILREN